MRTHARLPRSLTSVAVALLALASFAGCLTPPAMLPARDVDLATVLLRYPAGTEQVALDVEPGVTLRGVFVPSDPGAPVVVHLLESSGSCASKRFHFGFVTRQLSDLGFASLIVDYTGIGVSSGEATVDHLERDARAIWDEAVRRAGGEKRVYVRATSIGSIATALLLRSGARPAQIVLIAPVFADTAAARFARTFHGAIAGFGAGLLYRSIADVDLAAELGRASVPTLAIAAEEDELFTSDDRQRLEESFPQQGSHVVVEPGNHIRLCLLAHALLVQEARAFRPQADGAASAARIERVLAGLPVPIAARFSPESEARARLVRLCSVQRCSHPVLIAAAALANARASVANRMLWLAATRPFGELDFDELCEVLSLDDPAGEIPIDVLEEYSSFNDLGARHDCASVTVSSNQIAYAALESGRDAHGLGMCFTITMSGGPIIRFEADGAAVWRALLERGLSLEDATRQFMRILLKAQRIPDRVRTRDDGRIDVETKDQHGWSVLDPETAARNYVSGITMRLPLSE